MAVFAALAGLLVAACGGTPAPSGSSGNAGTSGNSTPAGNVYMLSTQGQPVDEAQAMRDQVLGGFNGQVTFDSANQTTPDIQKVEAEAQSGKGTIDVLGFLHGEVATVQQQGDLMDLTPLLQKLEKTRQFDPKLVQLGKLGTSKQYYIPWMQATYFMVANKSALKYLPKGANINSLTYDQLVQWAANTEKGTGQKMFGLPANIATGGGLVKRFVQGYLLPSYTGTQVTGFKSPEAVQGWQMVKKLWQYTSPQSTTYSFMQTPLLSGEVQIAWDHQARMIQALDQSSQFVAFPAPRGPKGLGYEPVVAGLAIPKTAPNKQGAEQLIDYLTRPQNQVKTASVLAFFPTVANAKVQGGSSPGLAAEAQVTAKQAAESNTIAAQLPVGLGAQSTPFDDIYNTTFERIVVNNQDIQTVLNDEGANLQKLLDQANAPCWPPDKPSNGPCKVA
ncbi:MAG: extracellular solute-binding protein [Candidatus Dormibacteraeota bacterium]|nr:extracellular solute-binding protein [Candidatus Dormibacteraeota bacterium]